MHRTMCHNLPLLIKTTSPAIVFILYKYLWYNTYNLELLLRYI